MHGDAELPGSDLYVDMVHMDDFTAFWNKDPKPPSIVTAALAVDYEPGSNGYVTNPCRAAGGIRLALDENNELAIYVRNS